MNRRSRSGIHIVLFVVLGLQLFPVSPAQAWFGNSQCKKAVASANKSIGDDAILSRIIVNNRKCFNPTVVAKAQLCIKWDGNTKKSDWLINHFACEDLPTKFK